MLSIVASLIPDLLVKVIENIRDANLIEKEKQLELERIKKASKNGNGDEGLDDPEQSYNDNGFTKETSYVQSIKKKKKVRVFYVPTGLNKVFDTKVKEERIDKTLSDLERKPSDSLERRDSQVNRNFTVNQRF